MYVKIFSQILDSSIWLESHVTLRVWVTLLVSKNRDGFARFAALENLAHRARVSVEEAREAVAVLEAPDKNSSDEGYEGRRIERVPGGWMVLNSSKYAEMVSDDKYREATRERVRRHREKQAEPTEGNVTVTPRNVTDNTVTLRNVTVTHVDVDVDLVSRDIGNSKALVATELGLASKQADPSAGAVNRIFGYWQLISGHNKARLTAKRKRRITDRLREGYTEEELQAAIAGNKADAFHQGDNDRGTVFDDIELICRDGEHVEKFIGVQEANGNGAIIRRAIPRRESTAERRWRETAELCAALDTNEANTGLGLLSGLSPVREQ